MMTAEEIEQMVQQLPVTEFRRFSDWFDEYKASQWDSRMARDAEEGRLDHLIKQAKGEYAAGRTKPL